MTLRPLEESVWARENTVLSKERRVGLHSQGVLCAVGGARILFLKEPLLGKPQTGLGFGVAGSSSLCDCGRPVTRPGSLFHIWHVGKTGQEILLRSSVG